MKRFNGIYFPLILILCVLVFFSPFLIQHKLPIPSDTIVGLYHPFSDQLASSFPNGVPYKNYLVTDPVRQQYPWRYLAFSFLSRGNLPLWNPYNATGAPLLGNIQNGVLYPLNMLFLFLPFQISWSVLILLEPIFTGLFLYFYLRRLRVGRPASFLGGYVFAFCGFSVMWLEWGTVLQVALWLPLILLAKEHLFEKITWRWSLVLLFADVSAFLGGYTQTLMYLLIITVSYVLVRLMQQSLAGTLKQTVKTLCIRLAPFILLGAGFLIITAIVWVPALQFILLSARNVDQLNAWLNPGWFLPWQNLIQFLAPDFFGNPATLNYWGTWNYIELTGYVGIFPLILAFFALFNRHDKKTFYFGMLFFISLIFSLPDFIAKVPFILNIPYLSSAQPTRLLFVTDFTLAVLSALGLDYFLGHKNKKIIFFPLVCIGVFILFLWSYVLLGKGLFPAVSPADIQVARANLIFPSLLYVFVCIGITLFVVIKNVKAQMAVLSLLLLLSVFDLFRFAQKFTPFTNSSYLFPANAILTYLQRQPGQFRIMTTDNQILPPNFSIMYHLQSIEGYDPLYLLRYGEFISAMERGKPDIHSPFGFNRIITPHVFSSPLINLLGVKYVISLTDISSRQFVRVYTQGQTQLFKNKRAFPRAFFVNKLIPEENKQNAMREVFAMDNKLQSAAVVEGWTGNSVDFAKGSANIVEYTQDKIVIATNSKNLGFLVVTDAYYPAWHAEICSPNEDLCKAAQIYITDYMFRGIIVPKGQEKVVLFDSLL